MKRTLTNWLLGVATIALLAACASGPTVRVNKDPSATLAGYQTFNFMPELGTDREGYQSIVSTTLKDVTTAELTRRGYTLSDNPDFLVNFGAKLDDKLRVTERVGMTDPWYGYYGYRRGFYDPWYGYAPFYRSPVDVDQYEQGTLNIDIVDAEAKRLVWESVAVGRVTEEIRADVPAALRRVVPQMLADFPPAR